MANGNVGGIERLVEGLVDRGIGVSGITRRAVGQADIERQKSLGQSLAESRARQAQISRERGVNTLIQSLRSRAGAVAPRRGGGGSSANAPLAVVVPGGDGTGTTRGAGGKATPGSTLFGITTRVGGSGARRTEKITSIQDLQNRIKELREQGVRVVLPGAQNLSNRTIDLLQRSGLERVSDVFAQQQFLGRARRGVFSQLKAVAGLGKLAGAGSARQKPGASPPDNGGVETFFSRRVREIDEAQQDLPKNERQSIDDIAASLRSRGFV